MILADINNDGYQDIIIHAYSNHDDSRHDWIIWFEDGGGGFEDHTISFSDITYSIHDVDMNHDGIVDVLLDTQWLESLGRECFLAAKKVPLL